MKDTYATKGLPPPPPVAMTTIPMSGLLVDVYGLTSLPPSAPVTCLWLLHPRLRTRARMHDIAARVLSAWQSHSSSANRGLIALAFDMPNHGTRLASEVANKDWLEGNEKHALDMWGMIKGSVSDMKGLMDLVEGYIGREVDAHLCLGWSLGGHAAWQAWMGEERIDAAVVIVGCPDYLGLMGDRAKSSKLDCGDGFVHSKYFPPALATTYAQHDPKALLFKTQPIPQLPLTENEQARLKQILDKRIKGKRLLLCSGGDDDLVPYAKAEGFVKVLQDAVNGWYQDGRVVVDDRVYAGVGHRFNKDMVEDTIKFLVEAVDAGPRKKEERSKI